MRKNPRILITNDDGIHAPGIKLLEKIALGLSKDVWVVAPEVEQSGAGHSLTINSPIRYAQVSPKHFAVDGTPTDCVMLAVREIVPGPIDLVLSGINRGKNIGEDVTHSGTVAGAIEGTLCDIPSLAFSLNLDFGNKNPKIHWAMAEKFAPDIIRKLSTLQERDTFFNINFPDCAAGKVKGIKVAAHGKRNIPKQLAKYEDPKGRDFFWLTWPTEGADKRRPDCDIKWLMDGYITITPICIDLTNYKMLKRVKQVMEE